MRIINIESDGSLWCTNSGYTLQDAEREKAKSSVGTIVRTKHGKLPEVDEGLALRFDVEFERGAAAGFTIGEPKDISTLLDKSGVRKMKDLNGKQVTIYYWGGLSYGFCMK